jgi:hypothetical protein
VLRELVEVRRFQAGGGASGSPDNCRCRVFIGEEGLLLWLLSDEGDLCPCPFALPDFEDEERERARASSYGF